MKWFVSSLVVVLACSAGARAFAAEPTAPDKKLRIGTYDNRAIAVAFAPSKYNPVAEKMKEMEKAKAAGDEAKQQELKVWGEAQQRKLHRQGFGRAPVDDLLAAVKDKLPEAAHRAGVAAIVWQCDYAGDNVEIVDVTDELVRLFEPSERVLKIVKDLKGKPPLDLDVIEKHRDK